MNARLGRSIGPGSLEAVKRGNGPRQWVLRWTDASGTRRQRALSTDRVVAERMRIEIVRQRDLEAAGLGSVEGQSRPLQELVDMYVEDLQGRSSKRHHEQVRQRLNRVVVALRSPRVRDVVPYAVSRLRAARVARGAGHRTANLETDTLKACFSWAVKMGLIAQNPIANIPRLPETKEHKRRVRRALSDDEIERLLAAAEADDVEQSATLAAVRTIERRSKGAQWSLRSRRQRIPQAPLWRAFLETGARYGELTATTWRDVDLPRRTLKLRPETTKSGSERLIPLTEGLVAALDALGREHERILGAAGERVFLSPDGAVWSWATTNAMRTFERLCTRAGIERVDADGRTIDIHALRHSFASRLARNGVGLAHTQKLLGHSDPKLTAKAYTHLEVEDLRGAIESTNPDHGGRAKHKETI